MSYDQSTAQTHKVEIQGMKFDPDTITVAVGDTVEWTNRMGLPHTVTPDNDEFTGSGALAKDASFSHRFEAAGQVSYHCEIHPHMMGAVIIE